MFSNEHMNQGDWPTKQSTAAHYFGQSLLARGFPINMTVDGFKLNMPLKNPMIPNSLTDEALSTYDDKYIPHFENNAN